MTSSLKIQDGGSKPEVVFFGFWRLQLTVANVGMVHKKFGVDDWTGVRTGIYESLKTRVSRPLVTHVFVVTYTVWAFSTTFLMVGNHFGSVFRVAKSKYKLVMTSSVEIQDGGGKPEVVIFGRLF